LLATSLHAIYGELALASVPSRSKTMSFLLLL
jgi:hypothetical protein